jgi:hypothetical protein
LGQLSVRSLQLWCDLANVLESIFQAGATDFTGAAYKRGGVIAGFANDFVVPEGRADVRSSVGRLINGAHHGICCYNKAGGIGAGSSSQQDSGT